MPLIMSLLGGLTTICGSLVGRVLLALGMSFVTFKGTQAGIDFILVQIKTNMGAMPRDMVNFFAWLWIDKAISMIFSAHAAAVLIRTAGAGSITKLITKS